MENARLNLAGRTADAIMNAFNKEQFSTALLVFRDDEQSKVQLGFVVGGDKDLVLKGLKEMVKRMEEGDE